MSRRQTWLGIAWKTNAHTHPVDRGIVGNNTRVYYINMIWFDMPVWTRLSLVLWRILYKACGLISGVLRLRPFSFFFDHSVGFLLVVERNPCTREQSSNQSTICRRHWIFIEISLDILIMERLCFIIMLPNRSLNHYRTAFLFFNQLICSETACVPHSINAKWTKRCLVICSASEMLL